jgi:hypothetical protein
MTDALAEEGMGYIREAVTKMVLSADRSLMKKCDSLFLMHPKTDCSEVNDVALWNEPLCLERPPVLCSFKIWQECGQAATVTRNNLDIFLPSDLAPRSPQEWDWNAFI